MLPSIKLTSKLLHTRRQSDRAKVVHKKHVTATVNNPRRRKKVTLRANSTKRWTDAVALSATASTATRLVLVSDSLRTWPRRPRCSRTVRRISLTFAGYTAAPAVVAASAGRRKHAPGLSPHELTMLGLAPAARRSVTESRSAAAAAM